MYTLALTVTASAEELSDLLEAIRKWGDTKAPELTARQREVMKRAAEVRQSLEGIETEYRAPDYEAFARAVSDAGARLVELLIKTPGEELTAEELSASLGIGASEFYGIVGSLGRAWKKIDPREESLFASRWSRAKNAPAWSLSVEVAIELRPLFGDGPMT